MGGGLQEDVLRNVRLTMGSRCRRLVVGRCWAERRTNRALYATIRCRWEEGTTVALISSINVQMLVQIWVSALIAPFSNRR